MANRAKEVFNLASTVERGQIHHKLKTSQEWLEVTFKGSSDGLMVDITILFVVSVLLILLESICVTDCILLCFVFSH